MNWTVHDANGVEKSAGDWGLRDLRRLRVNQAADLATFRAEGRASDADPLFAHGSTVRIFRDGTPWFYGRVIEAPGRAAAQGEEQLYRLAGPWWHLENLVFQQAWVTTNGVDAALISTNSSRIIPNQTADGTRLATGAAIAAVLAYATARGAPLAVGMVTAGTEAPYEEGLDLSCAEVIRRLLRWTPDAAAAFDYATEPFPTLSIRRRGEARTIVLPAYGPPVSQLELTPRPDLQAPAVVLKFEQTHDIDHDTFTSLTVQPAPPEATGDELGALVMTLDLAGSRATYQRQAIRVEAIPTGSDAPDAVAWWRGKFAWLGDFAEGDLAVAPGSHTRTIENAAAYPGVTLADLPNELLAGSIRDWMEVKSAPLLVQAALQYTGTDTDASQEVWGPTRQRNVYTRLTGTNAQTQTYARLTSATTAEPVPTGPAAEVYDSVRALPYDGFVELTENECSGAANPGDLLNLAGGRAAWASMAAQVQRVEEEPDLGWTRVTVGPAKHLGHGDLQELLRVTGRRRPSYRAAARTSGQASGNAVQVDGGDQQPRSDSTYRPSAAAAESNRPFELLDASDAGGLKVKVNPNSFLLQSLVPNDLVTVSGLGAALAVSPGTLVWLEVDFSDNAATGAAVASGGAGWSGFPQPFAYTGTSPNQVLTAAFVLIGYVVAAGSALDGRTISGGPADARVSAKVVQCVTDDLLLTSGTLNGMAGIYPMPHHAPYVAA